MSSIRSLVLTLTLVVIVIAAGAFYFFTKPTLQAVTDADFVPFEMPAEGSDKMVGFDMDILAEVAERAGFDYDIQTMDFADILPAVQDVSADIALAAITITDEREQVVDFTLPYYHSGLRIMVSVGNIGVKTIDDLKGLTVATKEGSTSQDYLTNRFGNDITIKLFSETVPMYEAVTSGAADAALYDAPNASYYAQTTGQGKVTMVGPLYEAQPYGIAFPSGSTWVDDANAALKSMMADGTYAKIYGKWFGNLPSLGG